MTAVMQAWSTDGSVRSSGYGGAAVGRVALDTMLSTSTQNGMLEDRIRALAVSASLHTADPGPNGTANEASGGGYARASIGWETAKGGRVYSFPTSWDVPVGTFTHVALWDGTGGHVGNARLGPAAVVAVAGVLRRRVVVALPSDDPVVWAADDVRLLLHLNGTLQAPVRLDPDTRAALAFGAVGFGEYDDEQMGWPVVSVDEDFHPLALCRGAYGAAMWFGNDPHTGDPALWLNQASVYDRVAATLPTLTDGTKVTFEVEFDGAPSGSTRQIVWIVPGAGGSRRIYLSGSDNLLHYYDGSSVFNISTDLTSYGVTAGVKWRARVVIDGANVTGYASIDDGASWGASATTAGANLTNFSSSALYLGSSSTSTPAQWNYYGLAVRDGGASASKVAHFTPDLFVSGNRLNGCTAVDAHDVTWTITRTNPSLGTDTGRRLPARSAPYFSLPGVSGEYLSTPDTAANSITGDLTLKAYLPEGINGNHYQSIISKSVDTGGNITCRFLVESTFGFFFAYSPDGVTINHAYPTVAADFSKKWLAVYIDVDNGAGGHDVYFYTSDDGINWDQLGTKVTVAGTITLADTTAPWELGTANEGASIPYDGPIGWVEIISGDLDGTLVHRFDAADADPDAYTWTDLVSGATCTRHVSTTVVQAHAELMEVGQEAWQSDGASKASLVGDDRVTDFDPAVELTLIVDARVHQGAGTNGRLLSSRASTVGVFIYRPTSETIRSQAYDGSTSVVLNTTSTIYGRRGLVAAVHGNSDHEIFLDGVSEDTDTAALSSWSADQPVTLGCDADGTDPGAATFFGFAIIGATRDAAAQTTIATEGLSA